MKKRVLAIMLVCFMLVSLLPMGALAEEIKPTCPGKGEDHYQSNCSNEFVKHEPGTCGGYAYDVYKCLVCGDHFADNFDKLDGACDMQVVTAPTCEAAGSKKCSICGKTEVIPALGHVKGELVGNCETGYTAKCTVCGKTIESKPGEHDWGTRPSEIVKDPTLTENGLAKYTCVLCGAEKEVVILSHICEENLVDVAGKDATCTEDGYTAHKKCTVCNELFGKEILPATPGYHTKPEAAPITGAFEVTEDDVPWGYYYGDRFTATMTGSLTITTNADWVATSVWYDVEMTFKRADGGWSSTDLAVMSAGQEYTVQIEAGKQYYIIAYAIGGFSYSFEAGLKVGNCTTSTTYTYNCTICGTEVVEDLGLNHSDFVVLHEVEPTCTTFGYKVVTCVDCGYNHVERFDKLGHTEWQEGDYKYEDCSTIEYTWYCDRCGERCTKEEPSSGCPTATETVEATCNSYGYTFTYCTRGSWCAKYDWSTNPTVSSITGKLPSGEEVIIDLGGRYMVISFEILSDKDASKHNPGDKYEPIVHEPTCTQDGLEIYWCMDCHADIVITTPATGHTPGEVQIDEPTCDKEGRLYQTCVTCGEIVYAEAIEFNSDYVYMSYESAANAHVLEGVEPEVYYPGVCGERYQLDRYVCAACGQYILVKNDSFLQHIMPETLLGKDDPNNQVELPDPQSITLTGSFADGNASYNGDYPEIEIPFDCVVTIEKSNSRVYVTSLSDGGQYSAGSKTINIWIGSSDFANGLTSYEVTITFTPVGGRAQEFCGVEPTCTADGYTAQYYCTRCDKLIESTELKALGHDIVVDVEAADPTCTTAGTTKGEHCSRCEYAVEAEEIAALGHNHVLTDNLQPADRKANDTYTYDHFECTRCEDDFIKNFIRYCMHEKTKVKDRKAATCTEDGYITYCCADCGTVIDELTKVLDRKNHVNAAGDNLEICANDDVADRKCKLCEKEIAKVGHDMVITYYSANCLTSEYYAENCQNCAAYIIHDGKCGAADCVLCSAVNDELGEHNWSDWAYVEENGIIIGKARVCKVCGEEQTESVTCIAYSAKIENALVPGAAITDGSTVKVTISITGSEDNVWGFKFDVPYTENLSFEKAEFVTEKFTYAQVANDNGGYVTVIANANGNETLNTTEAVVELYFNVTTAGQFSIETLGVAFANIETLDADGNVVESLDAPATVKTIVLMDLDLDGAITLADALALYNLIETNGYNAAADLDKDSELTLNDFLALYDYLSGVLSYEAIVALK